MNGPYVKKKSLISRVFFALLEKLGFKSILKEQELAVETSYEIVKTPAELAAYLESGGEGDLILHFEIEKKGSNSLAN